jgi:hypothetical protein
MVNVLGRPELKSRPLTSMVISSSNGNAEPMRILISSAVRSSIVGVRLPGSDLHL